MALEISENIDRLIERLDQHITDDGEQFTLLGRMDERVKNINDKVERISHVLLDGNGSPPLTIAVATLTQKLDSVTKQAAPLALQTAVLVEKVAILEKDGAVAMLDQKIDGIAKQAAPLALQMAVLVEKVAILEKDGHDKVIPRAVTASIIASIVLGIASIIINFIH